MSDTDKIPDIDAGDNTFPAIYSLRQTRRERHEGKDTKPSSNDGVDVNLNSNQNHTHREDNNAATINNNTNRREPRELRRTLSNLLLRIESELRTPVPETERPEPRPATATATATNNTPSNALSQDHHYSAK